MILVYENISRKKEENYKLNNKENYIEMKLKLKQFIYYSCFGIYFTIISSN